MAIVAFSHLPLLPPLPSLPLLSPPSTLPFLPSPIPQIPTLVCGPFGCGKTRTLRECIKLLLQFSAGTKILLATQSNSAADLYVQDLDKELNGRSILRELPSIHMTSYV